MSLAIMPKTREASGGFSKALGRFQKEDPTFKVCTQHQPSVLTQAAAHSHPWNAWHAWHSLNGLPTALSRFQIKGPPSGQAFGSSPPVLVTALQRLSFL